MKPYYEFIIKDKNGNALASLDTAQNRRFNWYLNKSGDASFDISIDDPKLNGDMLLLGDKELYIYRNNQKIWGGELTLETDAIDDTQAIATFTAKGFFDLLSKKIVGSAATPRSFSATDAGSIISTLLTEVQTGTNASFNITTGVIETSVNRTVSYSYQTLQQIIQQLSSDQIDNGFDFDVDQDKKLNIWAQRGRTRNDIILEYGKNFTSFRRTLDASGMANEIIVLGNGSGGSMAVVTVDNTTQQPVYKIRQATISKKDYTNTGVLTDFGQQTLDLKSTPQQSLVITYQGDSEPFLGTYNCGDYIRVRMQRGFITIDDLYRVHQISVTLNNDGLETIQVTLDPFIKDILDIMRDLQTRLGAIETA